MATTPATGAENIEHLKHHEIVILGGHFAAVSTAHYLLRHICPVLADLNPETKYHVTMIAPHKHFFWNIAAPRHLCAKELIQASRVFLALNDAFKCYPANQYTFVQGKATSLDAKKGIINVSLIQNQTTTTIDYSSLIIATGRRSNSPLWQVNDTGDETIAEFSRIQDQLKTAKSVLIAGGGPIGVETAGEIASHLPGVSVSLFSGNARLLPHLLPGTSAAAEMRLKKLGVNVIHGRRCVTASQSQSEKPLVHFDSGSPEAADVFIDATGGRPNSDFLPKSWVNGNGFVRTDSKTLRVDGEDARDVYAIGDVASYSDGSLNGVFRAVPAVANALGSDIANSSGLKAVFPTKEYSPMEGTQLVPTGPKGGVGQLFGWRIPSFLVWLIKSRTFFVDKAGDVVSGSGFQKP